MQTALVNDTLKFYCEVQSPSVLDLGYVWVVNGLRADSYTHNRFVPGMEAGSLLVYNITFSDFGIYECQAVTPVHKISAFTQLAVEGDIFDFQSCFITSSVTRSFYFLEKYKI